MVLIGIRGATNTNIVMLKQDDESKVLFATESRDVESTNKIIEFNKENCTWEVISGNAEETEYSNNPIVITIKTMLEESPEGIETTMTEVKDRMCKDLEIAEDDYAPQSISREIGEHLIPLFMRYDNIRCKRPDPNGGTKGRKWQFYYEKSDDVSETDNT